MDATPPSSSCEDCTHTIETMLPMRDGVRLHTFAAWPRAGAKCPVILVRTPYRQAQTSLAAWLEEEVTREALERGYARVEQECRGTADSEGVHLPYVDERADSLDTLAWLRTLPCYNGEILAAGASYTSSVHFAYLDTHPTDVVAGQLVGQCCNRYAICFRNGFFKIGLHGGWFLTQYRKNDTSFARNPETKLTDFPLSDLTQRYLGQGADGPVPGFDDVIRHPRLDDPFWRTPGPGGAEYRNAVRSSSLPILFRTGFYDIYTGAILDEWNETPCARRANCALVVDAFDHGGNRYEWAQDSASIVHFPRGSVRHDFPYSPCDWFDHVRLGRPHPFARVGEVSWYSLWNNVWRHAPMLADGDTSVTFGLATEMRLAFSADRTSEAVSFVYDPFDPPSFKGSGAHCFGGMQPQEEPRKRGDLLTFLSAPLERDLDVQGKIRIVLAVTSDCEDSSFAICLSVRKNGKEGWWLLRDDITSLCREGGDYTPGDVRLLRLTLVEHAFLLARGDVLRLDIAGANAASFAPHGNVPGLQADVRHPRVARNAVLPAASFLSIPTCTPVSRVDAFTL